MLDVDPSAWQDLPLVDLAQVLLPLLAEGEVQNARVVCKNWHTGLNHNVRTVVLYLSGQANAAAISWGSLPDRFPLLRGVRLKVGANCSRSDLRQLLQRILESRFKNYLQTFYIETVGPVCLTPDWQFLSQLPKLRSFSLKESDGHASQVWNAKGLSLLTGLTALSWLGSSSLPANFWEAIAALKNLQAICISHFGQNFSGPSSMDRPTEVLVSLPHLSRLEIKHLNSNLPLPCVRALLSIPSLRSISWGLQNSKHAKLLCCADVPLQIIDEEAENVATAWDELKLSADSCQQGCRPTEAGLGQLTSVDLCLAWPATQKINYLAHCSGALRSLTLQHMSLDKSGIACVATLTGLTELRLLRFIPMHESHMQGSLARLSTLTALEKVMLATDSESFFSVTRFKFPNVLPDFSTSTLKQLARSWTKLKTLHLEMELGNFSGDLITAIKCFKGLQELTMLVVPVMQQVQAFRRFTGGGDGHHLAVTLPDLPFGLISLHLGGVVLLPMEMQEAIDRAAEESKVAVQVECSIPAGPQPYDAIDYVCPLGPNNYLARPSPESTSKMLAGLKLRPSAGCVGDLVSLRLECCCMDKEVIEMLCSTAQRLERLALINNSGLNHAAMPCLGKLQMLRELEVCDNPSAMVYDLHDLVESRQSYTSQVDLSSLAAVRWLRNLRRLSWTVEDAICNIVETVEPMVMLSCLQHLHLSCVWNNKGDVQSIFEQLVRMQLPHCAEVELCDVNVSATRAAYLLEEKRKISKGSAKADRQRSALSPAFSQGLRGVSPANSPRGGLMRKISRMGASMKEKLHGMT